LKKRKHHKIKATQKVTPMACIDPVEHETQVWQPAVLWDHGREERGQKPVLSFDLKFTEGSGLLLKLLRFVFILVCHTLFTRNTMAAA